MLFGLLGSLLGASWEPLGASWGDLGAKLSGLGVTFGALRFFVVSKRNSCVSRFTGQRKHPYYVDT